MTKVGIFINSIISNSEFEKIIEPYLKDESFEVYSNFSHPKVIFFENKREYSLNSHVNCRERITAVHSEFYSRFNNTPLYNKQFNFWTHLRFNSYLQLFSYYEIKVWIDNLNQLNQIDSFVFEGLNKATSSLVKLDFSKVTFIDSNIRKIGSTSNYHIILKFLKALFYGAISISSLFKKQKDTLLISLRGSVGKTYSKGGVVEADKFMHHIQELLPELSYETSLNSNLFSKKGIKDYSYDYIQKSFDIKGENILFYSLFKPKFYRELLRTRKFLKHLKLDKNSFLDVILSNNKSGVYTELLTFWSYHFFFKKRTYKNIVLASEMSPGTNSIVRASKQFGINSIGIQHGLLNKNNFAYNYLNEELLIDNPFPSKLIVWGKEEGDFLSKNNSILKDTVQERGNIVLDGLEYLPKRREDEMFTILFATQPQPVLLLRMKSLIDFVDSVLNFNSSEVAIIIRLHPREVNDYSLYQDQLNRLANYSVEIDKGQELFSQINKSDVVVTSYSTVSKDAMILRKPIVLQDYSGTDLTGLLTREVAKNAIDADELFNILNHVKSGEFSINKDNYEKMLQEIYASVNFDVAEQVVKLLR